ncbi:MAG TPA: hypothetical protein PKK37_04385, partial [Candidatus Pacearchaeota archaeon]|nr:hypothetical protein [Candidatus Pacearchaeota archaeon]
LRVQDSAEADKFVVTNAGRVGIGTTSPAYTLDVNGGFRAGNATSTNALVLDPNTGNVGVGTASPVQKLHVEGHCITGDSELAIVSPPNQEEQIRKIQIKDVQPGTQVLTLNEQTNRLEARAINKLLDMGVQAVFRLTTSSGKTIRTTGNHPYLAKISSAEQQQRISLREIGAMEREYGIDKNGLSVDREFSQTKTIWAGESEIAATKKPACADSWTSSDSVQISGLSPNAIIADAPILSMAAASRRDFRVVEVGGIEPPNPWVTIQSSHRATPTTSELYHENDDGAKWTKVIYLSVGDEIATVSLDHRLSNSEPEVSWEKISSIEYVGQEQVYDIEVAGTHNFVANEILAHNTYISGNVGIGTASPAEALDVNGRVRLAQTTAPATVTDKLYNVSGNLLWNGIDLTSGGALPVGTEGQMLYNNAGAWTAFDGLYWDDTTSRLGIGTTAPIYKFNVAGANAGTDVGDASLLGIVNTDTTANNTIGFAFGQANLSGTIQTVAGIDLVGVSHADGAQSGALAFSTRNAGSWSERLRIDNTGNVGIGTTAPSGLLHVAGGQCVTGDTLLRVRRRRKR